MPSGNERWLKVSIGSQRLTLFEGRHPLRDWPVSTALNGPGELMDSGCTPRGEHRVKLMIGRGCSSGTVFVGRRPTGEVYGEALAARHPKRDWILSRIIWLTGIQSGYNRGGRCDTLRRFVYIHGCPDSAPMGVPLSHGCVRMRNVDVIELFGLIERGTRVVIADDGDGP